MSHPGATLVAESVPPNPALQRTPAPWGRNRDAVRSWPSVSTATRLRSLRSRQPQRAASLFPNSTISVAWPSIQRVVTAVVRRSTHLIVTAIVAEIKRTLNATLISEQASSLGRGGQLYLRTEDGVGHAIPYTIES